jgi:hypothetical protein
MNEKAVTGLHLLDGALREATLWRAGRSIEVALSQVLFAVPISAIPNAAQAGNVTAGPADPLRIACLPSYAVISRHWRFPRTDAQTLRKMVAHRLEADLPLPLAQITWDCRCSPRAGSDGLFGVLIQAARTDQVTRHLAAMSGTGRPASVLTTEAEALQGLYRYGLKRSLTTATEALVLPAPEGWLVAIFTDGMIHSLRRLSSQPRMDLVARECRQALDLPEAHRPVERVWWLAAPEYTEARDCLAGQLKGPVESAESSETLLTAGEPLDAKKMAEFGPAIGLALSGLFDAEGMIRLAGVQRTTLSPRRQNLERILLQPKRWAILAAALTLLALVLHVGSLKWETGRMLAVLAETEKAAAASKDLPPKLQAMQRLQTYRLDAENTFAELAQVMPATIVLSSVQFSRQGRMVLKGTAKDPKAIFTLADALRKSKRFQDVNWDRAEPAQGGTFIISMDIAGTNPLNQAAPRGGKWH